MATAQAKEQYYKDHYILVEYRELQKYIDRINGVYVVPSSTNLRLWEGVVFVRQSFYAGGIFRFILTIPTEYGICGSVHGFGLTCFVVIPTQCLS